MWHPSRGSAIHLRRSPAGSFPPQQNPRRLCRWRFVAPAPPRQNVRDLVQSETQLSGSDLAVLAACIAYLRDRVRAPQASGPENGEVRPVWFGRVWPEPSGTRGIWCFSAALETP